jgi:hypothetical protein
LVFVFVFHFRFSVDLLFPFGFSSLLVKLYIGYVYLTYRVIVDPIFFAVQMKIYRLHGPLEMIENVETVALLIISFLFCLAVPLA